MNAFQYTTKQNVSITWDNQQFLLVFSAIFRLLLSLYLISLCYFHACFVLGYMLYFIELIMSPIINNRPHAYFIQQRQKNALKLKITLELVVHCNDLTKYDYDYYLVLSNVLS